MKKKTIDILSAMSKELRAYLKLNNSLCVDRIGKNDIIDALLYKMYYNKSNMTQQEATIKLNQLKLKFKKLIPGSTLSSRQSLAKKENKLDISFYNDLSSFLAKLIDKYTRTKYTKYTKQVIACDGVFSTLLKSLSKDGFKTNKKNESTTPLISGLFNVTTNYPICLDLVKTKDERLAFMNFIQNKDQFKNNIFVFDKGYYSHEMVDFMFKNNFYFAMRLKNNSRLITDSMDNTSQYKNGNKLRTITYIINKKKYYIATNLYNESIGQIKSIYHDRWTIEEYFKYIKTNLKLAKMNEKNEKNINKSIITQLIVSQITFLFVNMHETNEEKQVYFKKKVVNDNDNYVLNKRILTNGLYDDFLFKFFNNVKFTKYYLLNFLKEYISFVRSNKGKHFKHTCKRANYRWYFKKYFKNVKSEDE